MTDFSEAQKDFMKDLFSQLNHTINEKTEEIRNELKTQISQIKSEFGETVGKLKQQIEELQTKNEKLQQNNIYLERKSRKNNIIIFGIEKEEQNVFDSSLNIFRNILEIDIRAADLNDVYRIPTRSPGKYPVVVEFQSFQRKLLVLKNANKLKGKNIYIVRDQCMQDRLDSKVLISHQKKARAKGQTAYIKGGKLYVAEEEYTVNQLREINIDNEEDITETTAPTVGIKRQLPDTEVHRKEEQNKKRAKSGLNQDQQIIENPIERVRTRSTNK